MTKLELLEKLKSLGDNDSVDDIISIKESDYKDDLKDLADKAGGTFNPEGVKVKKPTSVDEVSEQAKDLYRKMHEDDISEDTGSKVLSFNELPKEEQDKWFNTAMQYKSEWAEDSDEDVRKLAEYDARDIAETLYENELGNSSEYTTNEDMPPEYTGNDDFEEYMDYVLSNWKGDLPAADADTSEWNKFYADGSPYRKYEDEMWSKAPENAKKEWLRYTEANEEAGYPVYTTSDDTGLVWKDPVAFKKFVAGPLLMGIEPEDRPAAMKRIMNMTPEELINDRDTAGSYTSFMSDVKDDSGATVFDPDDKRYAWDKSLRDIYGDNDVFSPDLLDFIDNFNGEIIDVNGDGDPDVSVEGDSATVVADDPKEAKEGVKAAKESLAGSFAEGNDLFNTFDKATSKDKLEQDSTGSLNDKPQEETSDIRKKRVEKMSNSWGATNTQKKKADCTVSDENEKDKKHPADCSCSECKKSKDQELSDFRFKNILGALQDKLW